ncbi:MAG: T9SS type A sorting domain-containing protein [Bacteroidales bacterium]|nr:T9SS type A sorting domain-containing protein [Bacteroidales bacterium]
MSRWFGYAIGTVSVSYGQTFYYRFLTVSASGEYSVEVLGGNNCYSFDTVQVSVYSDVDIDLGDTLSLCPDSSLVLHPGSGFDEVVVKKLVPYTNLSFTDTEPPDGVVYYRVGATKLEPCYPSVKKTVAEEYEMAMSNMDDNEGIGQDGIEILQSLLIYPNPATDYCTVQFPNPERCNHTMHLMSLDGKVVRIIDHIKTEKISLELNDLLPGYYWIRIMGTETFQGELVIL